MLVSAAGMIREPADPWFVRALRSGTGRVRAGGLELDVVFERVTADLDAAYHAEYHRYGPAIVGPVLGEKATIRLLPRR